MILIHTSVGRSASTWLESILLAVGEELRLRCEPRGDAAYRERIAGPGLEDDTIHPGVFLRWDELGLEACPHPWRVVHVRRDPRDALVSAYYATLLSHAPSPEISRRRVVLEALSKEEGLLYMLEDYTPRRLEILTSHLGRDRDPRCLIVEFGDLVSRPRRHVRRMLALAGWRLPWRTLRGLVESRRFEVHSGGRRPGQEDPHHHYRKGIVGDWSNHFTPRLTEAFKAQAGKALVELGYERSLEW